MSLFKTIKDSLGNIIYPATHARAVFVEDNNTTTNLQDYLDNLPQLDSSGTVSYENLPTAAVDSNPTAATIASYPDGAIWIEDE